VFRKSLNGFIDEKWKKIDFIIVGRPFLLILGTRVAELLTGSLSHLGSSYYLGEKYMRDAIIEEVLRDAEIRSRARRPERGPVVPSASRYPLSAKRAALERNRQPWSRSNPMRSTRSGPPGTDVYSFMH